MTLVLSALRSDDPLGFLAALGLVEVATTSLGLRVELGWDGLGGPAMLEAGSLTVEDLARRLAGEAKRWRKEGRVAPPADPVFLSPRLSAEDRKRAKALAAEVKPAPKEKSRAPKLQKVALDPMRLTFPAALARFRLTADRELAGAGGTEARWLVATVCQLGRDGDDLCAVTPVCACTAQQTLRQVFDLYGRAVAGRPEVLAEALTSWRRDPMYLGPNLDDRDVRDAAVSTGGKATNASVPGASWLALMSVPFFTLSGDGHRGAAVGWVGRRGGRPRDLYWPVWRRPLSAEALAVLLSHPLVRRAAEGDSVEAVLRVLGVEAVLCSRRRSLANSDGPLTAPEVVWPAEPSSGAVVTN